MMLMYIVVDKKIFDLPTHCGHCKLLDSGFILNFTDIICNTKIGYFIIAIFGAECMCCEIVLAETNFTPFRETTSTQVSFVK